jgi:hypothetical protein
MALSADIQSFTWMIAVGVTRLSDSPLACEAPVKGWAKRVFAPPIKSKVNSSLRMADAK